MNNTMLAVLAGALLCSGCGTVRLYDGERREANEIARISGDYRVTAGAPVTVILRQVDGRNLNVGQRSVEVLPGTHQLLVDCRILETDAVSRHALEVEVFAGRSYRLSAETAPGLRACSSVALQESD